jgi:hypothetical protein
VTTNYRNYNVGIIQWAAYGSFWAGGVKYTYLWLLQKTPILLALEGVTLLWAIWQYGFYPQRVRIVLLLLTLSAIGAIAYFPDVVHVAFVVPYVLVVLAGMVYRARTALAITDGPMARPAVGLVWAAALAVILVKGWTNFGLAWEDNPILFPTAFGTLAGREIQRDTIKDLHEKLHVKDAAPPRLFAYPTDAWIYLALPADNPTPFCLLRPVYNTPEQFKQAMDQLDRDPQARVLLNVLFSKPEDPFIQYLNEHWHDVTGVGPGVIMGAPLYRLYAPNPKT